MTSATLSIEPSKWASTIEGAGEDCLKAQQSARNVDHVLSTATARGPQKTLCAAVIPFIKTLQTHAHGISILTSLIRYGTVATVEIIAEHLLATRASWWSLTEIPPAELLENLGQLLERFVYREDATGEHTSQLVEVLRSSPAEKLCGSALTVAAVARLMTREAAYAQKLARDGKAVAAFTATSQDAKCKSVAVRACSILLHVEKGKDVKRSTTSEEEHQTLSSFVFSAVVPAASSSSSSAGSSPKKKRAAAESEPSSAKRPREELLHLLAAHATPRVVSQVGTYMSTVTTLAEEVEQREAYSNIVALILERCDRPQVGAALIAKIIRNSEDVASRLSSRKSAVLRLLGAMSERPEYVAQVDKQCGGSMTMLPKLKSAKMRYTHAVMPRNSAIQQTIAAKIKALGASSTSSNTSAPTRKAEKRKRE